MLPFTLLFDYIHVALDFVISLIGIELKHTSNGFSYTIIFIDKHTAISLLTPAGDTI